MCIKHEGGDYKAFTFEIWWKLGQREDNKFAIAKKKEIIIWVSWLPQVNVEAMNGIQNKNINKNWQPGN